MKKNIISEVFLHKRKLKQTILFMRLTILLSFFLSLNLGATVYSQKTQFTFDLTGKTVREVFQLLEQQSKFRFFYNDEFNYIDKVVNLNVKDESVEQILQKLFVSSDITYKVVENNLVVLTLKQTSVQQQKITGVITDATNGEPIIGANIIIEGTTIGVVTDVNGKFSLDVPNNDAVVIISFLGYNKESVKVNGQSVLNVKLVPDITKLDEIVVVGYGTQKKSDIISSVTSVKAEKLTKVVTLDVGEMLRGKAAGVQITTSDAGPGGSSNIQIRGKGSLAGGTAPIVIADGVQIGSINDINPGDISSVEILKDAAAQAIYGARASNGVILITTKRGKAGKATVNYSAFYGAQRVKRHFDVYSPEEYAQLKREAYRTNNADGAYGNDNVVFSGSELQSIQDGTYIDWEKEVMRIGSIQNHDLSVSAGTENTKVFLSTNFQKQEGVVPNTDFTKGMIRFNLDQNVNKWLKVGLNSSLSISKSNDPGVAGVLNEAIRSSPLGQVYNADGTLKVHPTGFQENWNPLNDLKETSLLKNNRNDMINLFVDINPIAGLNYRINVSRRSWNYKQENYNTVFSNGGSANGMGSGSLAMQDNSSWTIDNILSYEKTLGKSHLSATVIQSWNEQNDHRFDLGFPQMPNDLLGVYGLESALSWKPSISGSKRRLNSFATRLQYDFSSKYYITLSGRRDGSSVFGAENKWGLFPAVALGWNVYKESFMENFTPLTNLKLRASYGSVGNEAIGPYGSLASADQWDYYSINKISGYAPGSSLPNPKLKWETSTTLNAAIDFGFFENRLSGTVELYKTNTTNLLVNRNLNSATGYTTMKDNIGEIENRGIEFQLDGVLVRTKDLNVQVGFLFSKNNNKILKLFGDANGDGIEDDYIANNWFIGKPIDVYYTWESLGIWQESEAADIPNSAQPTVKVGTIKVEDKNGDKKLDNDDRVVISRMPKWSGSFNLNASFKGIDFSMDVTTVQGILKYNKYLAEYAYGGDLRGIFNGVKVDYWTPENPTATFPRPTNASTPSYMALVARQDASYVKLQNLSLGYTLPTSITSKIHVSKLRIYCTGQNLFTKTKYLSYSPEQDPDAYPEAQSITGGIQLSF